MSKQYDFCLRKKERKRGGGGNSQNYLLRVGWKWCLFSDENCRFHPNEIKSMHVAVKPSH